MEKPKKPKKPKTKSTIEQTMTEVFVSKKDGTTKTIYPKRQMGNGRTWQLTKITKPVTKLKKKGK